VIYFFDTFEYRKDRKLPKPASSHCPNKHQCTQKEHVRSYTDLFSLPLTPILNLYLQMNDQLYLLSAAFQRQTSIMRLSPHGLDKKAKYVWV